MRSVCVFALALVCCALAQKQVTYHAKYVATGGESGVFGGHECELIDLGPTQIHRIAMQSNQPIIDRRPLVIAEEAPEEGMPHLNDEIIEVFGKSEDAVSMVAKQDCSAGMVDKRAEIAALTSPLDEVQEIVISGPSSNRIDVVFMGDGYRTVERQRHMDDMTRLTEDMFEDITFVSWLPLFNIWGVFRESAVSGIGVGGVARNTAYRLYRQGTELRGIMPGNAAAARAACRATGPNACDFPSLIGNDEFYGGLGGEFTISTRSLTSGTVVLRHEMGHNFVNVGEEYDGGQVYRGVNYAASATNPGWQHWLTTTPARREDSIIRVQNYAWYDLARGPYTIPFTSDGTWNRWFMRFTVSGAEADNTIQITLDGVVLPWRSLGNRDRLFYTFEDMNRGFSQGSHSIVFRQLTQPTGQIRQLCSITVHEYRTEDRFRMNNPLVISSYQSWRQGGASAGFRPNNERCLMRNMSSPLFCVVCIEGMWMQFLNRMELIDEVEVTPEGALRRVALWAVPLAQLRTPAPINGEAYTVRWSRAGVLQPQFNDQFEWQGGVDLLRGQWSVTLAYTTPEIRRDPNGLTRSTRAFAIN